MKGGIPSLSALAEILSLLSQEDTSSTNLRRACHNTLSAIRCALLGVNKLDKLREQDIKYYCNTIFEADTVTDILLLIEDTIPILSYIVSRCSPILEDIPTLYNRINSILDGIENMPSPWRDELSISVKGIRKYIAEDDQVVKRYIALACTVMVLYNEGRILEANSKIEVLNMYCKNHYKDIHNGFNHINTTLLSIRNRIKNDIKPQADKIIEQTCRTLRERLSY